MHINYVSCFGEGTGGVSGEWRGERLMHSHVITILGKGKTLLSTGKAAVAKRKYKWIHWSHLTTNTTL